MLCYLQFLIPVFQSMVNFLKDPSGDLPWEEDERGKDIFHIQDAGVRICFL